jgi:hypothetical protein
MASDCASGYVVAWMAFAAGCGPSVVLSDPLDSDGTTATPATDTDTASGHADATSDDDSSGRPATGSPATDDSESGGALDDSAAEDSSTGETWLFPPGSSWTWLGCDERTGATKLLVELYVEPPPTACVPEPTVDENGYLLLGVSDWNGDGGTFAAGPDGTVQGSWGLSSFATGTVELTVAEPSVPEAMWLDLQTEDGGTIVGLADLGTCFNPPRMPCE